MIGLVTEQARTQQAALKAQQAPDTGELSGRAAVVALETGRETEHSRDCKCPDCRDKTPGMLGKRIEADSAGMMPPGPISPEDYQRARLTEGHSAPSHQAGATRQPYAPAVPMVTGKGPIAETLMSRTLQRTDPRPDTA